MRTYGVSTGETGDYGVGDIFEGTVIITSPEGEKTLDGEPVFTVFETNGDVFFK